MPRLLSIAAALGGLCGVAALVLGAVGLPVTLTPPELAARLYSQISVHLWFLEVILLLVGLAVGVLGVLGYQSLKDEARLVAAREARKHLDALGADTDSVDCQRAPKKTGQSANHRGRPDMTVANQWEIMDRHRRKAPVPVEAVARDLGIRLDLAEWRNNESGLKPQNASPRTRYSAIVPSGGIREPAGRAPRDYHAQSLTS